MPRWPPSTLAQVAFVHHHVHLPPPTMGHMLTPAGASHRYWECVSSMETEKLTMPLSRRASLGNKPWWGNWLLGDGLLW